MTFMRLYKDVSRAISEIPGDTPVVVRDGDRIYSELSVCKTTAGFEIICEGQDGIAQSEFFVIGGGRGLEGRFYLAQHGTITTEVSRACKYITKEEAREATSSPLVSLLMIDMRGMGIMDSAPVIYQVNCKTEEAQ